MASLVNANKTKDIGKLKLEYDQGNEKDKGSRMIYCNVSSLPQTFCMKRNIFWLPCRTLSMQLLAADRLASSRGGYRENLRGIYVVGYDDNNTTWAPVSYRMMKGCREAKFTRTCTKRNTSNCSKYQYQSTNHCLLSSKIVSTHANKEYGQYKLYGVGPKSYVYKNINSM